MTLEGFQGQLRPRHPRAAVLLLFHSYFVVLCRGVSRQTRAKWASSCKSHCFSIVINNGRTLQFTATVKDRHERLVH